MQNLKYVFFRAKLIWQNMERGTEKMRVHKKMYKVLDSCLKFMTFQVKM